MKKHITKTAVLAMILVLVFSVFAFAGKNEKHEHNWNYYAEGKTLYAKCSECGKTVSVTVDTASVYDMARDYVGGKVEYDVIREDHWNEQDNIAPYFVLYDGDLVDADWRGVYSYKYTKALKKPDENGNYTARIVLFSGNDPDDGSIIVSTEKVPFYLAMLSDYKVLTHGPNEIADLPQPKKVGDVYQVYSGEELFWIYYNDPDSNISLQQDIVLNPLVMTEDYELLSSTPYIYQFQGLGAYHHNWPNREYTKEFNGNGHIIYGLYYQTDPNKPVDSNYDAAGLISSLNADTGYVHDVILDNFYVSAPRAGGICGVAFDCSNGDTNHPYQIENCQVLNGKISGNKSGDINGCGGICGATAIWFITDEFGYYDFGFNKCISLARIDGRDSNAGGIVGYVEAGGIKMIDCWNYGNVLGGNAGGIAGQVSLWADAEKRRVAFTESIFNMVMNAGEINGSSCSGGLIGHYMNYQYAYEGKELLVTNARNIGLVNRAGGWTGGVVGGTGVGRIDLWNIGWWGADQAYQIVYFDGWAGVNPDHEESVTKLALNGGKKNACSSKMQIIPHQASPIWTVEKHATCTEEGSMVQKCLLCNKEVLSRQAIPATGHCYEEDDDEVMRCVYCGAEMPEEDDLTGSIFSGEGGIVFVAVIAVAVVIAGVAGIAIAKKKKNGNA